MSKAFTYFASEENMATAIDSPDAGIDLLFQLELKDWIQLSVLWDTRSGAWREALAYFGGMTELELSMPLLAKALADSDPNIHVEAALSIADAIVDGDKYAFSEEQKNRLKEIAKSPMAKDFDEFEEMLKILK